MWYKDTTRTRRKSGGFGANHRYCQVPTDQTKIYLKDFKDMGRYIIPEGMTKVSGKWWLVALENRVAHLVRGRDLRCYAGNNKRPCALFLLAPRKRGPLNLARFCDKSVG